MNFNICIEDASLYKKESYIIIEREKGLFSISNCDNNGFREIKSVIIISKNREDEKLRSISPAVILNSENTEQCAIESADYVTAIAFVHNPNLYGAGEQIDKTGSIDIILLINRNLNHQTLLRSYSKALEGKVASLWDLDVRSPSWDLATGGSDDNLVVACTGKGNDKQDNTELQYLVGKCVRKAVRDAMLKSGFSKGVLDFIEGIGIKIDDLVEAGMELCVGVEKSDSLSKKLHIQILKSLEDLNVVSFIIAGIRLEEDYMKHRVNGVNVDDDPAYLYSDEVFGMSIANQIAGTKAIFNFKRYDEEKPGIISKLGPVLDDIFAGLIAGCMSKIFEE